MATETVRDLLRDLCVHVGVLFQDGSIMTISPEVPADMAIRHASEIAEAVNRNYVNKRQFARVVRVTAKLEPL